MRSGLRLLLRCPRAPLLPRCARRMPTTTSLGWRDNEHVSTVGLHVVALHATFMGQWQALGSRLGVAVERTIAASQAPTAVAF